MGLGAVCLLEVIASPQTLRKRADLGVSPTVCFATVTSTLNMSSARFLGKKGRQVHHNNVVYWQYIKGVTVDSTSSISIETVGGILAVQTESGSENSSYRDYALDLPQIYRQEERLRTYTSRKTLNGVGLTGLGER